MYANYTTCSIRVNPSAEIPKWLLNCNRALETNFELYKANVICTTCRPKSRVENAFLALKTENNEVQARGGGNLAVECLLASPS